VADILGERIIRLSGTREPVLIGVIMLTCGALWAFMNNIRATAVLLPAVAGISRRAKVPLSKLLIALSFSSLLGGNMTLIGAPPNVLATVIAVSTSFLTPVGCQASVLLLGPGGYRFSDYTRVDALLNIFILVATLVALPLIWPLT